MRFLSPFRVPKYQRFEIKPRYYDPVKEELAIRQKRIRQIEENGEEDYQYASIKFTRKTHANSGAGFIRLLIAAVLGAAILGWLYYGNWALYAIGLLIPLYLLIRLRSR